MTVETRCEWSDLPASMCACTHCRPDIPTSPLAEVDIERRLTAAYDGICGWCHGPIEKGDTIGRTTDRDYICERCLP